MPNRISSIKLEKFKGATNKVPIEFDTNKPVVIIFGENGTGKSTIVDAIDFICNERFGSIEDLSTKGYKKGGTADLITSLGNPYSTLKVEMDYVGNTWIGTIGHGKKPSSYGTGIKPKVEVLRRRKILDVVAEEPAKRYKALESFINVPKATRIEGSLRNALNDTEGEFTDATNALVQGRQSLSDAWEEEGKPDSDYLKWSKTMSETNATELKKSVFHLTLIIQKMNDCTNSCHALHETDSALKQLDKSFKEIDQEYNEAKSKQESEEGDIIDVLEKSQEFLELHPDVETCPVCETEQDAKQLTARIAERLTALKELRTLKKQVEDLKGKFEVQEKLLLSREVDWIINVRELAHIAKDSTAPEFASLGISWNDYSALFSFTKDDDSKLVTKAASELSIQLFSIQNAIESRLVEEGKKDSQLNLVKASYRTYKTKDKEAQKLEKKLDTLSKLHEILKEERKLFVQNELTSISGEVDSLYKRIHPNEGLGSVQFYLDPNQKSSLFIQGNFQGEAEIPPQAYYSESHLDTLGVCVFLALAKKYSDDNTIVILDDVITSVDQAHMQRVIDMLHDEAGNFNQLIITTHYRPWKDRYKYYGGPTSNIQLIELLHWSHPRGIQHTKIKLSVEELEEVLQDIKYDRQAVASKAGILLEGMIDHIALRYGCKMPRKAEPNYTLGELVGSIEKKLKSFLIIVKKRDDGISIKTELASFFEDINSQSWIRNEVGCHFRLESNISDSEVKQFGNTTTEFAKVLICDHCGELSYRDKSGSYWECRCGKTQMHPHQIPT